MQRPRFKRHWDDRKWQNPINSMTESATSNMLSSAFFLSPFLVFLFSLARILSFHSFPWFPVPFCFPHFCFLLVSLSFSRPIHHHFSLSSSKPPFYLVLLYFLSVYTSYIYPLWSSLPLFVSLNLFCFYLFVHLTLWCSVPVSISCLFFSSLILILLVFPCRLTDSVCAHLTWWLSITTLRLQSG